MEYVTQLATVFSSLFGVSLDIFVLAGTLVLTAIILWQVGKGGALSLLISLYISSFIFDVILRLEGYKSFFSGQVIIDIAVFVVLYIVSFVILKHFIHGEYSSMRKKSIVQITLLTLSTWGILYSFLYSHFSLQQHLSGSQISSYLFLSDEMFLGWLLLGLICMYIISKR